jgi:ATP-dependent helicase/nuclease subunit B
MKRRLIAYLIGEQLNNGRLQYFRPIASTNGLVDLVYEFISEMKRLEIWPDDLRRACQARGFIAKDRDLLELYDAYQLTLRENHLYDTEGRFWSARDGLQRGQRRPFENLRLVVADGFTDFTRTQHEILELLSGWVEELIVSLPLESEPRRSDLFGKPLKTLSELKHRHPNISVREVPRSEKASWPAMSHLEKRLFINPRLVQSAPSTEGIEILAARKPQGEIELLGTKIKRLLADGIARPGDIAVVFRSPQDKGGLVAEIFNRLGIPVAWERGQTLDRMPILRAFTILLQLDLNDWPFQQLLSVLGSNYFQPNRPEWQAGNAAKIVEQTIRGLQIPRVRVQLLKQLNSLNDNMLRVEKSDTPSSPHVEVTDIAPDDAAENPTLSILNSLAAAFDQLPKNATLPQWAKAWVKLAQQTGLLNTIDPNYKLINETGPPQAHGSQPVGLKSAELIANQDSSNQCNIIAWNCLMDALLSDEQLAKSIKRRLPELDRREALRILVDVLGSQRMPVNGDEAGCVRVLSATSVRSLQIPFLFLAGLSEKAFPAPDREDRLYSEAEYAKFIDHGLPLVARTQRMREEMLLFYEALTRATRRLYLSYPALDDAAQPLLPSPYLIEVEQAFGDTKISRTETTDFQPVPAGDEPLCAAELRIKAMADALGLSPHPTNLRSEPGKGQGKGIDLALLAGLMQSNVESQSGYRTESHGMQDGLNNRLTSNLLTGLELLLLRQDREHFGPADGMLLGKVAQKLLAAEFSAQRSFTASELEQYATCPYRFLLQNALKLEPIEDLALQLDSLERGQIVHDVLALFHGRVNESLGRPASPLGLDPEEFDRLMQSALDESLPKPSANPVQTALREVDRRLIIQWLAGYRDQYQRYDKLWEGYEAPLVPEFFEASFGKSKHRQEGFSIDDPLEFIVGKETIRISGRIDRIDTGKIAGQDVFNILDYKTGGTIKFSLENVARGATLQLPIYALAVTELLLNDRDSIPWQAGYWHISGSGYKSRQSIVMYQLTPNGIELTAQWEEMRAILAKTTAALVKGIRRGIFPVFNNDQHCTSYCPFSTVCRIQHIRALEKIWLPTQPK